MRNRRREAGARPLLIEDKKVNNFSRIKENKTSQMCFQVVLMFCLARMSPAAEDILELARESLDLPGEEVVAGD